MNRVYIWLADYYCMLKGSVMMHVFRRPPKHHLEYIEEGKSPIVILPGIMGRWAFLRPLVNSLSLDGHPVYIVPKLKNNLYNIPYSARIVRELIEEHDIRNAIIVAHSKGGLIGKYLLSYHNDDDRVLGMVALATPFSGSALARLIPHKAFWELLPDSYIIQKLKEMKISDKRIISIMPVFDNHVLEKNRSYLDGALRNVTVRTHGHHKIIYYKNIRENVLKAINEIEKHHRA